MDLQATWGKIHDYTAQDLQAAHIAKTNAKIWHLIEKNQQVIDIHVAKITELQDLLAAAEKELMTSLGEEKRLLSSLGTAQQ